MPVVKFKDKRIRFPDDMTDRDIQEVLDREQTRAKNLAQVFLQEMGQSKEGGAAPRMGQGRDRDFTTQEKLDMAATTTMGLPIVGDVAGLAADAHMYATDEGSRNWLNYLFTAAGMLPFVPAASQAKKVAARMKRAEDLGFTHDVYHGSTQDIRSFDPSKANPESDMGAGIYTTTSPVDASRNYADPSTSQDLQMKIELLAERIEGEQGIDYDDALELARKELVGAGPNVMPMKGRMNNPVVVGGEKPTRFEIEFDPDTEEEAGTLVEFIESMRQVSGDFDDVDIDQAVSDMLEAVDYEGGTVQEIFEALKNSEGLQYATDEEGRLVSSEVIRAALENMGFDGIIDYTPDMKWGTGSGRGKIMEGLEGEAHKIFFKPNQLRSINAEFDPEKIDSADLLSSLMGINEGYA